ncbi:MAG: hypothetical protein ACFFHV_19760 [Promethearchaeota archaeon]
MVNFFITVFWPSHKAPEVAKASFQSQRKYPDDGSLGKYVIYGASIPVKGGEKTISVYEPIQGKERDAIMFLTKRLYLYKLIEGVTYQLEIAATYNESLEIAGIKRE